MKSILASILCVGVLLNAFAGSGRVYLYADGDAFGSSSVTPSESTLSEYKSDIKAATKTGYTLSDWFYISSTNDRFLNGSNYLDEGEEIVKPDSSNIATMGNSSSYNYLLIAKCTAKTYTVTLDNQGGSPQSSSVSATYDKAMTAVSVPTKSGYVFAGYYTGANGSGTPYYNANGASANIWKEDVASPTLYAYWTPATYTLTLDNLGGSGVSSVSVTFDSAIPRLSTVPSRNGYEFKGYWSSLGGTGTQYYGADGIGIGNWTIAGNATAYANWSPVTYTISYNTDGGTINVAPQTSYTIESNTFSLPTDVTRTGWSFNGWYNSSGARVTQITKGTTGNLSFTAQWSRNSYSVTLNPNQGVIDSSFGTLTSYSYGIGAALPSPSQVTRAGYTFDGWYKDNNTFRDGPYTQIGTSELGPLAFYAKWSGMKYAILLHANRFEGDAEFIKVEKDVGIQINLPPNTFTRDGYEFAGWSKNKDGSGEIIGDGALITDLTTEENVDVPLYAQWKPITYKLLLDSANGTGVVVTNTLTYNVATNLPATPITLGDTGFGDWGYGDYYVVGWTDSTNNVYTNGQEIVSLTNEANAEVTFNAIWNYDIKFFANGGATTEGVTSVTQTVARGVSANLQANAFIREGYGFEKWTNAAATVQSFTDGASVTDSDNLDPTIQGATSLYACWTGITYTVTIDAGTNGAYFTKINTADPVNQVTNAFLTVGNEIDLTDFSLYQWANITNDNEEYVHVGWEYTVDGKIWNAITDNKFTVVPGITTIKGIWVEEKEINHLAIALGAPDLDSEFDGYLIGRPESSQQGLPKFRGEEVVIEHTDKIEGDWNAVTNMDDSVYVKLNPANKKNSPESVYIKTTLTGKGVLTFKYCIEGDWLNGRGTYFKFGVQTNATESVAYVTNSISLPGDGSVVDWSNISSWMDGVYIKTNDNPEVVFWQCVPIYPSGYGSSPNVGSAGIANVSWTPGLPEVDPEIPDVPREWLLESHNLPVTWVDKFTDEEYEEMAKSQSPNNKTDINGNPVYYWQDYVMGTDPNDPNDVFKVVSIEMKDSGAVINWHPNLNTNGAPQRVYTVWGSEKFIPVESTEWTKVNADDYGKILDTLSAPLMFFKVEVSLP